MALRSSVIFIGELDIAGCDAVRAALDCLHAPALIDLRNVRYIDASALHEFAKLAFRIGPGRVTMVVAPGHVRRVLLLVGFEQLFTIVDVIRPSRARANRIGPAAGTPSGWASAGAPLDG